MIKQFCKIFPRNLLLIYIIKENKLHIRNSPDAIISFYTSRVFEQFSDGEVKFGFLLPTVPEEL